MNKFYLAILFSCICSGHAGAAGYVGNAKAGQAAFRKCASCHQVGRYAQSGYGPQLNGIIGRKAAATPDFKYSEAMKKSGIVWTCLLYTSPSPRDRQKSRMPSSA